MRHRSSLITFSYFLTMTTFEGDVFLKLQKPKSPASNDDLFKVWLKFAHLFKRRRNIKDLRQRHQQTTGKAHLSVGKFKNEIMKALAMICNVVPNINL